LFNKDWHRLKASSSSLVKLGITINLEVAEEQSKLAVGFMVVVEKSFICFRLDEGKACSIRFDYTANFIVAHSDSLVASRQVALMIFKVALIKLKVNSNSITVKELSCRFMVKNYLFVNPSFGKNFVGKDLQHLSRLFMVDIYHKVN
jgi:hypothetical protein